MFERSAGTRFGSLAGQIRRAVESVERYYLGHQLQINGLAIIASSAFLVRYLTLFANPAPPGADYGNYLTNLHAAEGNDVTGGGVQYPGVFIAYLWILVSAFGELQGLLISGPLLAALVSIPSYMLLRNFSKPMLALLGSATITFGEWASEMIGWGGNPNLLGILFGAFFMTFLAAYLRGGGRRNLVLSAVFLGLTAGSHQISVVVFALAAVIAIAVARVLNPRGSVLLRGARALAAGVALSLPFAPFYLDFTQASPGLPLIMPTPITVSDLLFLFDWFFREALILWVPLIVAAVIGYRRLLRTDPIAFALGISLIASPLILMETIMSQHPVRPIYFLPLGIVPGAVAFVQSTADQLRSTKDLASPEVGRRSVLFAVTLAAALILVSTSQARMAQASEFYTVATSDVLAALRWIGSNTPPGSVVATSGPSQYGQEANVGCEWGWWIEGYAERESLCTADLQYLAWQSQVARSAAANRAFAGVVSFENGWVRAGDFAPYGTRGNPIVSGDFGLGYEALVYFDDATVLLTWTDPGTMVMHTVSAHDLSTETSTSQTNGTLMFRSLGLGPGVSILREVTVVPDSPVVWNNYTFQTSGNLSAVSVAVFGTSNSQLNDFDQQTKTLSLSSAPGFRQHAEGDVRIAGGAQSLVDANFSASPESSSPHVGFEFAPSGATFSVSFAVTAYVDRALPVSGVQMFTAKQVLADSGAGYVLVDKNRTRDYEWVAADQTDFRMAYQNIEVAVFTVVG